MNLKHITQETCEVCGSAARVETQDGDVGVGNAAEERHFACGRLVSWNQHGSRPYSRQCPRSPDAIAARAHRIRAIKVLLSTLTKLELPPDDAAVLAERIKEAWRFDIKEEEFR